MTEILNRLPYETLAGNLAPSETFKQLIENLRLAEEDARRLAVRCGPDVAKSRAWTAFANNFNQIQTVLFGLASGKSQDRTSVGYSGNG